ncbi:Uncharacterised protein [Sphingobacterium spiritivorum]|uniref:DUF1320 domain-containing protein n=1 Tax=Sphingobacterium spiritivorum TaxID=258 RepID=A0A380CSW4_SPHSI|nr:DUF1320 domain-containing protein [Sphingobacterium spiritivorum]SUJ26441.1 Uncharacterised protein [Sphingobacterium spiritivorum]
MAFISKEDFYSHIYEEAVSTISRGNDKHLNSAIQAATNQALRCMARYDTEAIFELSTDEQKQPYAELIIYIKDIAKWHFIGVCNVQVDYEVAKDRYKQAVNELNKIWKGEDIAGWPLKSGNNERLFRSGSSPKFNHY